jgi:hypothetical protein
MSQSEIQSDSPAYGRPEIQVPDKQEETARLGPFERLIGTLISPGETFEDVNRKPTWLVPLLISIVASLAFSLFFEWRVKPNWDKFFQTMVEKQLGKPLKELPPEQQAQMSKQLEWQKRFAKTDFSSPMLGLFAVAKFAIFYICAFLIPSAFFALGLMIMQAQTTFRKILSVVAWSWCATTLVSIIVSIAALMVRSRESLRDLNLADPAGFVPTNLAVILPSGTSPVLSSLLASFDVFTIWFLILLSIGFAAISGKRKFKTSNTAFLVFGLWAVWVLIKLGIAAIGFGPRS